MSQFRCYGGMLASVLASCLTVANPLVGQGQTVASVLVSGTALSAVHSSVAPVAGQAAIQQVAALPLLPPAVAEALLAAPSDRAERRLQVGTGRSLPQPITVSRTTTPATAWSLLANGGRGYSVLVVSPGAVRLRVHLESLKLPAGAVVLVYDPSNPATAIPPVTDLTLAGRTDLWTESLPGQQVAVECQVPPGVDPGQVSLRIAEVSHLYIEPVMPRGKEGTCHNDVSCFPAYEQQASGVARISFVSAGNTYVCTGCLLAEANGAQTGNYFLTANHCVGNQAEASTLELFWFFQTPGCNALPPALGTVPHTGGGADLLATSTGNDFAFLRLRQTPPAGTYRLNWTTGGPGAGETLACIHHPGGTYQRISLGKAIGSTAGFWGVQWSSGVTEGGSSGAPLLNGSFQVIGQLNAGFFGAGSSCNDPYAPDQFGRFDVTYPQIQAWLGGNSGGGGGDGGGGGTPPPTPFVSGTYYGLFYDGSGGVAQPSSGSVVVTTTAQGRFSGRLQIGSKYYSTSGRFDKSASAGFKIYRPKLAALLVDLQLDPADTDHLTGTVSDGNWTAQLEANRSVFDGRKNIAPQAGQYTIAIPGMHDAGDQPGGDGYGTVTVSKTGRLTFSGRLADTTSASQSTAVSKSGWWPLYLSLYSGQGSMLSWIAFGNTDTEDLGGQVNWIKPYSPRASAYKLGFNYATTITGSYYTRPAAGTSILNFTDGEVALSGGTLAESIADPIALDPKSRVLNLGTDRLSVVFTTTSGLFRGSVTRAGTTRPVSFNGVVLQKQNVATGWFQTSDRTGQVLIVPQ